MSWTAGDEVVLNIEFLVDDVYVIPDSATATVRDNGGAVIPSLSNITLAVDTTSTNLVIPAGENQISEDKSFENRFVSITFVHEGKTYHRTQYYKLFPFLPMSVTPMDVRRELGLSSMELPDEDIHLQEAYTLLKLDYGDDFTEAFYLGNERTIAANQAVAIRAALDVVDSLQFRVGVKHVAEDHQFERMDEFDLNALRTNLGQKLAQLMNVVTETTTEVPTLLVLTSPTDVITGE